MRARFRDGNDSLHAAAFFELYLHELLFMLGYSVTVHPVLVASSRHPDFLVQRGETRFYLEAIVANNKSKAEMAAQRRLDQVYDVLNSMQSPNFFIGVKAIEGPCKPPPARKLRSAIEMFLNELDLDVMQDCMRTCGLSAIPTGKFVHGSWKVEFFPIPKSEKTRGNLSLRPIGMMGSFDVQIVDDSRALREAIRKNPIWCT